MNKDLRRIFTAQLYFLNEFNSISQETPNSNSDDNNNETVAYLKKKSNEQPSIWKLIFEIVLNIIYLVIYYYSVFSDAYLCFCYFKNNETDNFLLTSLWFFLPSVILICGDIKAYYTKYFLKQNKLKFFYKSISIPLIYITKLNILYA